MENVREVEKVIPLFESSEIRKQAKVSEQEEMVVEEMVVVDEKMKALMKKAEQIALSNFSVLLTGETGVGKEELAKFIHKKSGREIFVSVNCAALPENLVESELFGHKRGAFTNAVSDYRGKFLLTNNGTLFLDEIGDMNLSAQTKILQVTDGNLDGKHDFYPVGGEAKVSSSFRIICASNQNLEKLVKDEKFRQDLFFRLNVITLHIPPLRERRTEIPVLAQMFLEKIRSKLGNCQLFFSAESLNFLSGLNWPGNVRQLQNLVIKAAALMDREKKVIEAKYLKELIAEYNHNTPETISLTGTGKALKDYKHKLYLQTLEEAGYVVAIAAKKLGLCPRTLYRFMQLSGLKRDQKINEKMDNFEESSVFQDGKAVKSRSVEVRTSKKEKTLLPPPDFSQEGVKKNETSSVLINEAVPKNEKRFNKELLIGVLEQNGWNQKKTARVLGTHSTYICLLIKKWDIKPPAGSWRKSQASNEIRMQNEPEAEPEEKESAQARQSANQPPAANQELAILKGVRYSKEALIQALETHGWSKTKMVAALKIGYQSVGTLVKKLDIKPPGGIWGRKPEYTKEKLELILKQNGWNQTRAAVALGITQARFSALAKNRGVVAPDGIWQRREQKTEHISREKLIELLEKNDWSQKKAAAEIGIKQSSVSYLCTARGVIPASGSWKKSRSRKPTALEIILGKPWPTDNK